MPVGNSGGPAHVRRFFSIFAKRAASSRPRKNTVSMRSRLFVLFAFCFVPLCAAAQDFAGVWEGALSVNGGSVRLLFRVSASSGDMRPCWTAPIRVCGEFPWIRSPSAARRSSSALRRCRPPTGCAAARRYARRGVPAGRDGFLAAAQTPRSGCDRPAGRSRGRPIPM